MRYELSPVDREYARSLFDRASMLRAEASSLVDQAEALNKIMVRLVLGDMRARGLTGTAELDAVSGTYEIVKRDDDADDVVFDPSEPIN